MARDRLQKAIYLLKDAMNFRTHLAFWDRFWDDTWFFFIFVSEFYMRLKIDAIR